MPKYKNILFDLDGTLVDTGEGIINGVFYACKEMSISQINLQTAKRFVGPPLVESFMNLCGLDKEQATLAAKTFRVYYADKGKYECEMYKNIDVVLQKLKENGFNLFVATSKPTIFAKDILEKLQLSPFFIEIAGSEMDNSRSKKYEIINYLVEKYHLSKDETLMVGDKSNDVIGGQKAEVDTLGVLYGYGDYEEISSSHPTLIKQDVLSILDIIKL